MNTRAKVGKLHKLVEPFYRKVVGAGRPPIGLARMLRVYVAQQYFGLSDEAIVDAIYDIQAIRAFVGIDLSREAALRHEGPRRRGCGIGPGTHRDRTAGNVSDVTQAGVLLHGDETAALGDAGYQGVGKPRSSANR